MDNITLYDCLNARVKDSTIHCAKGHWLSLRYPGTLNILRLKRGDILRCGACQGCKDFESAGEPMQPEDRGWVLQEKLDKQMMTRIGAE